MGASIEVRSSPPQTNPYLDSLIADTVFKTSTTIQYAFEGSPGTSGFTNDGGLLWTKGNAYTAFTQAVAAWKAVCNVKLQPYPFYYNGSGASFSVGGITWIERLSALGASNPVLGEHYLPASPAQYGDINYQHPYFSAANNARGGINFVTFMHEIGHGLGLEHPHGATPFPGVTDDQSSGSNGLNSQRYTVMSYIDVGSPSLAYGNMATPGAFDIAAVQALYGPNMSTNAGDTVYSLPGSNGPGTYLACIWDAGGIDTISAQGVTARCEIDLHAATLRNEIGGGGVLSSAVGIYGGFMIANNVVIENAVGGSANDTLRGNDANNQLIGGDGADALYGGSGDDALDGGDGFNFLDGGPGADTMIGGSGSNTYLVDNTNDVIVEAASAPDNDNVRATASFYLPPNIENLYMDGTAYFGVGNDLPNIIDANGADNLIIAGGGNDTVRAVEGNNSVFGQDGDDELSAGSGIDYIVGGGGNDLISGGYGPDALYGEDGNDILLDGGGFYTDILVAGNGNDTLNGQASRLGDYDLMDGGPGDDSYYVDTPADLTFEAVSGGIDTVYADINGAGYYLYPYVENLVLEANTPFGVGNNLDNQLTGNAIGNYLLGGAGNDTLNGKAGGDVLFGEGGADTFVFERATGGDVIGDFQPGVDKIQLVGLGFSSFAQVQSAFVENGGTTAINLGQGDFIVINGIANAQLTAASFLFA